MTKKNNRTQKQESYNWDEVTRPNYLRLVFSSMATALDIVAKESVILGRGKEAGIVDVDLSTFNGLEFGVSRQHAMIIPDGEGFVIKDLESSNGTVLNGLRLEPNKPYPIHDGDMLFLGRMAFTVRYVREGARLSRRSLQDDATDVEPKKPTRMLDNPDKRKTRTVEMRGLLNKLDDDAPTK